MKNKKTDKLLNILNNFQDKSQLDEYINSLDSNESDLLLYEYILEISGDKGFKKSDIIRNSDLYRTYGYEILNGKKLPSRNKLLQICIGNGFSLDQTNRCLTLGKLGVLYAKNPEDSILIYALNNKLDLIETNIILHKHNFEPLR